jgi:hypothetical protein
MHTIGIWLKPKSLISQQLGEKRYCFLRGALTGALRRRLIRQAKASLECYTDQYKHS